MKKQIGNVVATLVMFGVVGLVALSFATSGSYSRNRFDALQTPTPTPLPSPSPAPSPSPTPTPVPEPEPAPSRTPTPALITY